MMYDNWNSGCKILKLLFNQVFQDKQNDANLVFEDTY